MILSIFRSILTLLLVIQLAVQPIIAAATTSGGSSTFQASQFQAGGNITLKAGVDKDGNILDPNAKIYFATAQEYTAYREELYKTNGLWFVQSDKGKEATTAAYNQFGSKNLKVEATGGIIADVGVNSGNGETAAQVIGKLATQPGMEWLADLQKQSQDPNNPTPVQWQQVETAFRDWDYKQEGLTPQAAALIAIAVAIATQGAGANLLNNFVSTGFGTTTTTVAATSVTTTTYTTAGLIANAGLTTLTQQAATSLINNKGNLGKTLKQLGSSDSLKSLATSMVTAGLSSKLGSTFNLAGDPAKLTLAQQFQQKALNGLVSASVSTAIEGGSFDDKLKASLKSAAIDVINQLGAEKVGDLFGAGQYGYVAHKIAHAALGCAAGAAANDDCESGAIGGLAGSIAGEKYSSEQAATLTAAIAATLMGKDVNLAANVGTVADKFNRQLHQVEFDLIKAKAKEFAKQLNGGKEPTEAEILAAEARLTQQALRTVDFQWKALLGINSNDPQAADFLQQLASSSAGNFTDDNGIPRTAFTQDADYYRSGVFNNYALQNASFLASAVPQSVRIGSSTADIKKYLDNLTGEAKGLIDDIKANPQKYIDGLIEQLDQKLEDLKNADLSDEAKQAAEEAYLKAKQDLIGAKTSLAAVIGGLPGLDPLEMEKIYGDSNADEFAALLGIFDIANTISDYNPAKGLGKSAVKDIDNSLSKKVKSNYKSDDNGDTPLIPLVGSDMKKTFLTPNGEKVEVTASVRSNGSTLVLDNFSVKMQGSSNYDENVDAGTAWVLRNRQLLLDEAKSIDSSLQFMELRGQRITGAYAKAQGVPRDFIYKIDINTGRAVRK